MLHIKNRFQKWGKLFFILIALIILSGCILFVYGTFCENNILTVTNYILKADIISEIRIVQLSDLHSVEFGINNSNLIKVIKEQKPDIIVMTGDMINEYDNDVSIICELIKKLSGIADVYYGYGNHETTWISSHGDSFEKEITKAGAVILNNSYLDVEIRGNSVRIAGYMGYYGAAHMTAYTEENQKADKAFMEDFENTDRYKILLDHIPTSWVDWNYIDKYPVDLVFSGHYHGGLIHIPLIERGLYAPYVGWFPQYTKGMYIGTKATCVLSAGLGSEYIIPRINNPPEIVVVDLVPK